MDKIIVYLIYNKHYFILGILSIIIMVSAAEKTIRKIRSNKTTRVKEHAHDE